MLLDHVRLGIKVTVACIEVPRCEASAFGVMDIDEQRAASAPSWRNRPKPPAMPGCEDRFAGLHGHLHLRGGVPLPVAGRGHPQPGVQARLRHGRDPAHRGRARPLPTRSTCPVGAKEGKTLLARRGDPIRSGRRTWTSPPWCPELDIYDENWPIWTSQNMSPRPSSCRTETASTA